MFETRPIIGNEKENFLKQEAQKQLEIARRAMEDMWGIEDLTNIESFHLRHITEDCVKQYVEEEALQKEGKLKDPSANRIHLPYEITLRWLYELYSISKNELNIHTSKVIWSLVDNSKYEFDRDDDVGPQKKIEELRAKGQHSIGELKPVSLEFKEYIRRLREKAQIPERN